MISTNCSGDILDVGLSIKGQKACSFCSINKEDLKDGLSLVLKDSSYWISKFIVTYSNDERIIVQKEVNGSTISSKKAKFLRNLKAGEMISIECIYIISQKKTALSTTMLIALE
jgi:hypothetical protein